VWLAGRSTALSILFHSGSRRGTLFGMSTEQVLLVVEGMSCGHCEQAIENGLASMPGVARVKADRTRNMVSVEVAPATDVEPLKARIRELGYRTVG
jgi:copper chaperone CopZ